MATPPASLRPSPAKAHAAWWAAWGLAGLGLALTGALFGPADLRATRALDGPLLPRDDARLIEVVETSIRYGGRPVLALVAELDGGRLRFVSYGEQPPPPGPLAAEQSPDGRAARLAGYRATPVPPEARAWGLVPTAAGLVAAGVALRRGLLPRPLPLAAIPPLCALLAGLFAAWARAAALPTMP